MTTTTLPTPTDAMVEAGAKELTRRRLNGGDPNQPAVRWNGSECEPQDFPAWWDERDDFRAGLTAALQHQEPGGAIDIVFDGPPGPEAGRFVEVESPPGTSISLGKWIFRSDGCWALRIPRLDTPPASALAEAIKRYVALTPEQQAEMWKCQRESFIRGQMWGDEGTRVAAPPVTPPEPSALDTFQNRVQPWMMECFGPQISADRTERNHRFIEEALELVQANGCTQSDAHQLVDYVYGRPQGDINQEVGGVMVTLAALCLAIGEDMHAAGEKELARVWTKVDKIRAKQAAKPKHSPLPQAVEPSALDRAVELLQQFMDIELFTGKLVASQEAAYIEVVKDTRKFLSAIRGNGGGTT